MQVGGAGRAEQVGGAGKAGEVGGAGRAGWVGDNRDMRQQGRDGFQTAAASLGQPGGRAAWTGQGQMVSGGLGGTEPHERWQGESELDWAGGGAWGRGRGGWHAPGRSLGTGEQAWVSCSSAAPPSSPPSPSESSREHAASESHL